MHEVTSDNSTIYNYTLCYEYELPGWDEYNHTEFETITVMACSSAEATKLVGHLEPNRLILNVHELKKEEVKNVYSTDY